MAEVAEGALRLFSAWVRGSPYCGVQPLSVTTPIAEKFARHDGTRGRRRRRERGGPRHQRAPHTHCAISAHAPLRPAASISSWDV